MDELVIRREKVRIGSDPLIALWHFVTEREAIIVRGDQARTIRSEQAYYDYHVSICMK